MNKLILKPSREKSLKRRHPWVFSGAVEKTGGDPQAGNTIAVHSSDGAFLAYAAYSPKSQIVARAWSFHEADLIDEAFIEKRLAAAIRWRDNIFAGGKTNAARLVHAPGALIGEDGIFAEGRPLEQTSGGGSDVLQDLPLFHRPVF